MMNYRNKGLCLLLCGCFLLCGCSKEEASQPNSSVDETAKLSYDEDDWYIDNMEDAEKLDLDQMQGTVIIAHAGTYLLSGSLNGNIEVAVGKEDTVRLILNQVTITSNDGPAISAAQSKKLIISLPEGTENFISDQESYSDQSEDAMDAAIFVQDDLTFNGNGKLTVNGNHLDAIKTKDTLKLMSGSYIINAKDDGLTGKDFLYIHDCYMEIHADGDGMKTTYDTDEEKGDMIIENGTFQIVAGNDGLQAEHKLTIYDGSFTVKSGGGSVNGVTETNAFQPGGFGRWEETKQNQTDDTPSAKGIKSGKDMIIYGGIFQMDTSDDAFHSNGAITIEDGDFTIASGDDGFHADGDLIVNGGSVDIAKSYEGMEGSNVIINDGYLLITANDDGINAAGGSDGDNESQPSMDKFTQTGDHKIEIHGGHIQVDAKGDGIDSNGSVVMDGGSAVIFGPEDGANGALDYETTFDMNGGILIAAGSAQMAQAPSQSSKQSVLAVNIATQSAQTVFYLTDSEGNLLIGAIPNKAYSHIVISTPQLKEQNAYQLYVGGNGGNVNDNGYIENGLDNGTLIDTITLSDVVTTYGNMGMNPMGGGMGDRPNDIPDQLPSDGQGNGEMIGPNNDQNDPRRKEPRQ